MVRYHIRAKEHEISELKEEIKKIEKGDKREEREVENIVNALETKVRKSLEPKLQFVWQQIIKHNQQIISLRQEINKVRPMREAPTSASM